MKWLLPPFFIQGPSDSAVAQGAATGCLVGRVVHRRRRGFLPLCAEQDKLDGLGDVFKEGGPVLLLTFLDPVPIDAEGARVNQLAHPLERIGVAHEHLLGDRPHPPVVGDDADRGPHSPCKNLSRERDGNSVNMGSET